MRNSRTIDNELTYDNLVAAQLVTADDLDDVVRAIRAGVAYGNVHSSVEPGGEIRAQLQ